MNFGVVNRKELWRTKKSSRGKDVSNRVTSKKIFMLVKLYTNMYSCEITTYVNTEKIWHILIRIFILVLKSSLKKSCNLHHPNIEVLYCAISYYTPTFFTMCLPAKWRYMFIFGKIWHTLIRMMYFKDFRGQFFKT